MKRCAFLLVLAIALLVNVGSYAQSWMWAKSFTVYTGLESCKVATDADGNVIVAAYGYLAKYSPTGALLWSRSIQARIVDVCTDADNNILIAGIYEANVTFAVVLPHVAYEDIFVAKYDAGGTALWARRGTGAGYEGASSVAADAAGNIYIAGRFNSGTVTFGLTTVNNVGTNKSMFLTKYSPDGNVLWAKGISGDGSADGYCQANAIVVDHHNDILMTGSFGGSTLTLGATVLVNTVTATPDIFVAKFDGAGEALWAKSGGANGYEHTWDIAVDGAGNSYVAGRFSSNSIVIGTATLFNTTTTGHTDGFVASFDGSGAFRWAKSVGGEKWDEVTSIAADAAGNVYTSVAFFEDTITFNGVKHAFSGEWDHVICKYSTTGAESWSVKIGGPYREQYCALALDNTGNLFVHGTYQSNWLYFGPYAVEATISSDNDDAYTAKMSTATVGIPEIIYPQQVQAALYPNPVKGELMIRAEVPIHDVRIVDICGREVFTGTYNTKEVRIDTRAFTAGIYQLTINGSAAGRFVKE